ncbi:MAG: molybdopterin cofactor-binding domain-containing protein [Pseudomonadota bacterium]
MKMPNLNRREFLVSHAAAGVGLAVGVLPASVAATGVAEETKEVNAWVVIAPDDTVTVRIARSEMGQGTITGLAQMVAEELDCDWDKIRWEYPTPGTNAKRDRVWGSFSTGGSSGIRESHDYVRKGGAAAREMLIRAAAEQWQVPASECSSAQSVITHKPSGKTVRYGEVAHIAATLPAPESVTLKDPSEWKILGKPMPRLDTREKLDGSQIYGTDLQLPNMLNAAIRQCPVQGGKLTAFDADAARKMPGVVDVVTVGDNAVAVVAQTWWQAKQALAQVKTEWDNGPNAKVSSESINALLDEGLGADDAFVGNRNGDIKGGLAAAETIVTADYSYPFQNHAPMEPMNATALWTDLQCDVWCPTQDGEGTRRAAIEVAGLAPEQVDVHKLSLGGGFGRRAGFDDFTRQAVLIAKTQPGRPVKLMWSREEDMMQGFYHPITKARLTGGLDANGELTSLHIRISGQSILASVYPQALQEGMDPVVFQCLAPNDGGQMAEHSISYDVPNLLIDHAMRNTHLRPGWWRGVNVNQNVIYMECFLDELAAKAGRDPLEFRRSLMKNHPKSLAVLNAVAERIGWGSPRDGRHHGLAVCKAFDSYVAACAEVSVDAKGKLKMHRIVAATDPGYAVNPQQIEAQVAGSFVYGLSAMMYGECTVKDGAVVEQNFNTYPSLRLADMPDVETIVMPSGGFWGGVGEPTIAVAAPAVLNAIYAATGQRIRQLPIKSQSLMPEQRAS